MLLRGKSAHCQSAPLSLDCYRVPARQGCSAVRRSRAVRLRKPKAVSVSCIASTLESDGEGRQTKDSSSASYGKGGASKSTAQLPYLSTRPGLLRRLLLAKNSAEVADLLVQNEDFIQTRSGLCEDDCKQVLLGSIEQGNLGLAMSIYSEMCNSKRSTVFTSMENAWQWPSASLSTITSLVLGLSKRLCIVEALKVVDDVTKQGMPRNDDVGFGKVVGCPLAGGRPLAVVQPKEGVKVVADSITKYEYELFSGTVVSCSSEALEWSTNALVAMVRSLLKKPPVVAVHEFVIQAPSGVSRTFRIGTETADVPAQSGERITVVCSPTKNKRQRGLLSPSPPGTKMGEPLAVTNHRTGVVTSVLRPPPKTTTTRLPDWVLPTTVLMLGGGDAATYLIDPSLPSLVAMGAVALASGTAASNVFLLPKLKQLPDNLVKVESRRQELLSQHAVLAEKVATVMKGVEEDIRTLAKLWQLQNKMESANDSNGNYGARIGRVEIARVNIEERLAKRLELLDGYSKVINMIEIEVEIDTEVPEAEYAGIQEEFARLIEMEDLQSAWKMQAEANDEVERLLRQP